MTTPPYGHNPYAPGQHPYGVGPHGQPPAPHSPATGPYGLPALPSQPPVSGLPYPPPYPPHYGAPVSGMPQSPYGQSIVYGPVGMMAVDPLTGQPLSDKSKITAGLLQLLPGGLFALGGIGRLYSGNAALGAVQLVLSLVGWGAFWCGFLFFLLPWVLTFGLWLWFVIDGIVMLAGRPVDGQGRLLRR